MMLLRCLGIFLLILVFPQRDADPASASATVTVTGGGGVPAPAAAAGFNTNVMNVDFTIVPSTWPQNNIVQCGASASVPNQPSTWHFQYGNGFGGMTLTPCSSHSAIVNDSVGNGGNGLNALELSFYKSESAANSGSYAHLTWPSVGAGSPAGSRYWMSLAYYARLTFRFDPNALTSNNDNQWWATTGNGGESTWVDNNVGENNGILHNWGGTYWEWVTGNCTGSSNPPCNLFPFPDQISYDQSVYNTVEILWTNDGSSRAGRCIWLNANGNYNSPGPVHCGGGSFVNTINYNNHHEILLFGVGPWNTSIIPNDAHFYVQNYQVWSCSSFVSGDCAGTVVDHWPFP